MTEGEPTTSAPAATLHVPALAENLERVHDLLGGLWAAHPDIATRDRARVETAVLEIAGNVVEHGARADGVVPTIRVALARGARIVTAVIDDDAGEAEVPPPGPMPDWPAEDGRGLPLAHALCDGFEYTRTGGGNRWTLTWRTA